MFKQNSRSRYFEHSLLPNIDLPRIEHGGKRYYVTPTGNKYPSVTTVLSALNKDEIVKWRERVGEEQSKKLSQQASTRGTAVHSICENYLMNNDDYLKGHMPINVMTFKQMQPHLDKSVGRIYGNELRMYSDRLRTAGTCDLIAEIDGTLTICDFKTSKHRKKEEWITNYFYQCVAYAVMLKERHNLDAKQFQLIIATDEDHLQVITKNTSDFVDKVTEFFDNVEH